MKKESLREAYGKKLLQIAKNNDKIVVLDADLSLSTKSCYIDKELPERFFEMGISEQNMISTAAGLSLVGKVPFVNSFAVFVTGRAYDQIRQGIALPSLNVKIVGSSAGLSDFGDGATHQSIEDIAIMRAIPNMTVIAPVDANEIRGALEAIVEYEGPVYLRVTRSELPLVTPKERPFEIGKIYELKDGKDIVVFANGVMVSKALEAARKLEEDNISVKVINVPTIKPINCLEVEKAVEGTKGVITAEEHSTIGGLSSAILDIIHKKQLPFESIAIKDKFGQSAQNYEIILQQYGLTEESIIKSVKRVLSTY